MIPASELLQIQADLAAICLDKPCQIVRNVKTRTGAGQYSETPTVIGTCMAGMAQPNAGLLQNYEYKIGDLAAWRVNLPYGQDVTEQDTLLIAGYTLTVHVLLEPHTVPGLTSVIAATIE